METREISKASWIEFFDGFSKIHQGWMTKVEVLGRLGAQIEAEHLPLEGITADHRGKDIAIALGPPERLVEHFIMTPARVRIEEDAGETALQIESLDGDTTVVSLRQAARPNTTSSRP
jgi:uncharacterized protein DUF5335